jgi:GntR family transcriptional regulator
MKVSVPLPEVVDFDRPGIVDPRSPVPLYYQLATYIEQRIKAQEWRAGQVFPSEEEVCSRTGVSRTVVRQAMAELERKGLVVKRNGKRTTVAAPRYDGALMQSLRGFHQDALERGQQQTTRVLEFVSVPASEEVAQALSIRVGEQVIRLNRLRTLDGVPEVLVVTYLPEKLCPGLLEEDLSVQSLYELLERKYQLRIVRGVRTIEAVSLDRDEARLLEVKTGSPALLLKSIGVQEDGVPLEYFIARHRGDRCRFTVQLVREA